MLSPVGAHGQWGVGRVAGGERGMPLRTGDPQQLGKYRLLRRLGEGGMGSVYLADSPEGRTVALKIIRADLTEEPEFRRRFRSEVARAREVPPFCTAEVLDADPDHETPYLVVEYVDGPSLSEVVLDQGPLTPANLYGLAIGVATALAAIHGAGVIHRDLKPSNVLLAPGTPKVIDFGIARGSAGSDGDTRTDQLIGTVAYMAPERLDPGVHQRRLTPAADVFAWGAVVAFAATGRVPFLADSSPATAVAILTREPVLEGITEPLRSLVATSLAKSPGDRPTARDLLDQLLARTPRPVLAHAAEKTSENPVVVATVREYADDVHEAADEVPGELRRPGTGTVGGASRSRSGGTAAPDAGTAGWRPVPARAGGEAPREHTGTGVRAASLTSGLVHAFVDVTSEIPRISGRASVPVDATLVAQWQPDHLDRAVEPAGRTGIRPAGTPGTGIEPAPGGERRRSGALRTTGTIALVLLVLATAVVVAGFASGLIALPAAHGGPRPGPTGSAALDPSTLAFPVVALHDPLTAKGQWLASDYPAYASRCAFVPAGYQVTMSNTTNTPSIRCRGAGARMADFRLSVTVTLANANSCAGIWWHLGKRKSAAGTGDVGYALRVCAHHLYAGANGLKDFFPPAALPLSPAIVPGVPARVEIIAVGDTFWFYRDGTRVGNWTDTADAYRTGYIGLGMFQQYTDKGAPFSATFRDIEVDTPTASAPSPSASGAGS